MTKEELQAISGLLDEKLKPINDRLDNLEQGQKAIGTTVTSLELKIENETNRTIKVLGDGHLVLNRKLDEKISLDNRVEMLEHKVSALEFVVKNKFRGYNIKTIDKRYNNRLSIVL